MSEPGPERPKVVDAVGKLCYDGKDVAAYLYQVPNDEAQRRRMREILDAIIQKAGTQRELPRIAQELKEALEQPASIPQAELLQDGFDRLVKLWQAARSGLF